MTSVRSHLLGALIGAVVAGAFGLLFAPQLAWGLLSGGAMIGGAISVARVVLGGDE